MFDARYFWWSMIISFDLHSKYSQCMNPTISNGNAYL
jgi:hypothetical protein